MPTFIILYRIHTAADMTYRYKRSTHSFCTTIIILYMCTRPISIYCIYSVVPSLIVNRVRNRSVCNCRYTAHGAVYFMYVIFRFSSFRLFKFYGLFLKYIYYVASARPGLTLTNIYDPHCCSGRTDGRGTTAAVYIRRVRYRYIIILCGIYIVVS